VHAIVKTELVLNTRRQSKVGRVRDPVMAIFDFAAVFLNDRCSLREAA